MNTEDELWNLFEYRRINRGFVVFAIVIRTDAEENDELNINALGTIGYLNIDPQHRTLEIGAVLFSRALQRTAAATEAYYLLLRNVCETTDAGDGLPYRRVAWRCNHLNTASRRAAERLGFVFEGTTRNHMIAKGQSRDTDVLSMTQEEWPGVKTALQAWLDESNFDAHGKQIRSLEEIKIGC